MACAVDRRQGGAVAIGAVAEHLEAGRFALEEPDPAATVGGIGRSQARRGHEAGLGLDGQMGFVAVSVLRSRLVHVAGLGIDRRDDPVLGHLAGDAPGPLVVLFDVLACHKGQEAEGGGGVVARSHLLTCVEQGQGITHEPIDEIRFGLGVVPGDHRLARSLVVVGHESDLGRAGNGAPDTADRRDELGDRVLGGHGVVEEGRVERAARPAFQDTGGRHHVAHGVENAFGPLRGAQARPPIGEHAVVEALVVEGQPAGHLPADAVPQSRGRLTVREPLESLEHHDRSHHVGRDRGPATPRREEVGEHLVGEQLLAVVGQERLDRSFWHQLAAQSRSVEKLTVGIALPLHLPILDDSPTNREHRSVLFSTVS